MNLIKNKYFIFSLLIIFLALLLRFYKLGQVPVSLYWDEVAILIDAKTLANTGMDMHSGSWFQLIFPSYGDYKLPVYVWLTSLSVKLFGVGEWQLRLVSTLAGIGTVIVAGLMALELDKKNKKWALASMFVVAASPWAIMFSRTGFEGHLGQFFLLVSIYLLLLARNYKKYWLIILSVLFSSVATYTYFSVRFVWPVVFIAFQILLNKNYKNFNLLKISKQLVSGLLVPLALFFLLLIPMLESPLYKISNQYRLSADSVLNSHDYAMESNKLREIAGNNFVDRIIFHRHILLLKELAKNYSDNLSFDFLFLTGDANLRHGTGEHGLFLLPLVLALIAGFHYLAKEKWQVLIVLLTWWIIALLPASVPETTPHALRSLNALIPISLIISFGLVKFTEYLINKKAKIIIYIYCLLIIISLANFSYHYFKYYPQDSAMNWQNGYKQLAQKINDLERDVDVILVQPSHHRLNLWYLAYVLDSKEIQALPKENYDFGEINKIYFVDNDWSKYFNSGGRLLLVGEGKYLEEEISENTRVIQEVINISSYDKTSDFVLIKI